MLSDSSFGANVNDVQDIVFSIQGYADSSEEKMFVIFKIVNKIPFLFELNHDITLETT